MKIVTILYEIKNLFINIKITYNKYLLIFRKEINKMLKN